MSGSSGPRFTDPDAEREEQEQKPNLAVRIATAGVLVPILIGLVFIDPTPWGVLVGSTLVVMIAQDEYLKIVLGVTREQPACNTATRRMPGSPSSRARGIARSNSWTESLYC